MNWSLASGTFGGFRGIVDDRKIDYVLADDGFVTRAATIDRRSFDGRDPSDHFPVTAAVTFARPGPQPLVPAAQVPDSIVLATRPELGVLAADRAVLHQVVDDARVPLAGREVQQRDAQQ